MATFDPSKIGQAVKTQRAVPKTQPAATPTQQMPFEAGTILGTVPTEQAGRDNLTPFERQVLEQIGVDGLPPSPLGDTALGRRLADAVEKLRNQQPDLSELDQSRPPIQPPVPQQFDQLDPAAQQELERKVAAAAQFMATPEPAPQPSVATSLPYTQEELAEVTQKLAEDRHRHREAQQQTTPEGISHIPGMQDAWNSLVDDLHLSDTPAEDPAGTAGANLATKAKSQQPAICPHCYCGLHVEDEEITTQDKVAYLQAIMGGRFTKEYQLFDGHVTFVLRAMSPDEVRMIDHQLAEELRTKKFVLQYDYSKLRTYYFMAATLARVTYANGYNMEFPPISKMTAREGDATPLPALLEGVTTEIIANDSAWRAYEMIWNKFNRLRDQLDAKKDVKGFFTETAPVR